MTYQQLANIIHNFIPTLKDADITIDLYCNRLGVAVLEFANSDNDVLDLAHPFLSVKKAERHEDDHLTYLQLANYIKNDFSTYQKDSLVTIYYNDEYHSIPSLTILPCIPGL